MSEGIQGFTDEQLKNELRRREEEKRTEDRKLRIYNWDTLSALLKNNPLLLGILAPQHATGRVMRSTNDEGVMGGYFQSCSDDNPKNGWTWAYDGRQVTCTRCALINLRDKGQMDTEYVLEVTLKRHDR